MSEIQTMVIDPKSIVTTDATTSDFSRPKIEDGNRPLVKHSGYTKQKAPFATGTHGSFVTPFGAIEYLAGAKIKSLKAQFTIKMQPLSHVSLDKLKLKMFAVYVPNSRVWDPVLSDAFSSQKEDRFGTKVNSPPMGARRGMIFVDYPFVGGATAYATTVWRDSIAYHYYGLDIDTDHQFNLLYVRGYKALWNDIFRDKSTQAPYVEYSGSVSAPERDRVFHFGLSPSTVSVREDRGITGNTTDISWMLGTAPAEISYWNQFRPSILSNNPQVTAAPLADNLYLRQQVDEYRSQSQNINKTDAEIIAEIRGSYIAKQNQCYIIGQKTIDIDISLQPMTSDTSTLQLGAEGAISYTFASADIITETFSAPKDGIIHYLYYISSPDSSVWTDGINLEVVKADYNDFYRPSLSKIKDAPFMELELAGRVPGNTHTILGYRRRYSEYFRHPVFIRGDFPVMTSFLGAQPRTNSRGFFSSDLSGANLIQLPSKSDWHLLSSRADADSLPYYKNRVDNTQAHLRRILMVNGGDLNQTLFRRRTEQTFYLYGSVDLDINQPIADEIKNEFIDYGEE